MTSGKVFPITLRVILIAAALDLATQGGFALLWLLLIPLLVWNIVRTIKPSTSTTWLSTSSPPNAKFTEPGEYRVVLQVPGTQGIQVIKQIRATTSLDLVEAKKILDDAPTVVVEGLSEESAELVADRLRAAGAKALAAPIGEK